MYLKVTQLYIYMCVCKYMYPFQIIFCYRLLQDTEYGALCYSVGSCLFGLYIVMCIC